MRYKGRYPPYLSISCWGLSKYFRKCDVVSLLPIESWKHQRQGIEEMRNHEAIAYDNNQRTLLNFTA